jgi:hypothetical protein
MEVSDQVYDPVALRLGEQTQVSRAGLDAV